MMYPFRSHGPERAFCLLLVAFLLPVPYVFAQDAAVQPDDTPYATGAGLAVLLTNNGFGLGGYYSHELSASTSLLLDVSLGAGKDEQELKFFSRFGDGFIPSKHSYLLLMPVQIGLQHRLFRENIEDNFRPYLHVTGGPTVGWEYPYFRDRNGNNQFDEELGERRYDIFSGFPKGDFRLGVGGTVALGAYFGLSRKVTQGVRFGYTFTYFTDGIQLLEPDVKDAQHLFGSPIISITFGKLF